MPGSSLLSLLIAHPGCVVLVLLGLAAVRTTATVWPGLRFHPAETRQMRAPDAGSVQHAAENVAGVEAVHDVLVWTLPSGVHGFTGVVTLAPGASWQDVLAEVHAAARRRLDAPLTHSRARTPMPRGYPQTP